MVNYEKKQSSGDGGFEMRYDLMSEVEFSMLIKKEGVRVIDAYIHMIFDTNVVSSEDIIFCTKVMVGLVDSTADTFSQTENEIVRLEPSDEVRHNVPLRYNPGGKSTNNGGLAVSKNNFGKTPIGSGNNSL